MDVVAVVQTGACQSASDAIDYLAKTCLTTPLSEEKRRAFIEHLGESQPQDEWQSQQAELNARLRSVLILLVSMPEYQMM